MFSLHPWRAFHLFWAGRSSPAKNGRGEKHLRNAIGTKLIPMS
jgi:hypothetical protein